MGKTALAFLGGLCVLFLACPGPTGPQITELEATPAFLHPGDSTTVVCRATGTNLGYAWQATAGTFASKNDSVAVWQAPADVACDSVFTITVEVADTTVAGRETSRSVDVTVDVSNFTCEPVADAYVASTNPATNYGSAPYATVGYSFSPAQVTFRAYLRFDLSPIPTGYHIGTAVLHLWHTGGTGNEVDLSLHIVPIPWEENTITWANQPAFLPTPRIGVIDTTMDGYAPWVVTDFVQDWVQTPTGNRGLVCKITDEDTGVGTRQFVTREGEAGKRPYLEVVYW